MRTYKRPSYACFCLQGGAHEDCLTWSSPSIGLLHTAERLRRIGYDTVLLQHPLNTTPRAHYTIPLFSTTDKVAGTHDISIVPVGLVTVLYS